MNDTNQEEEKKMRNKIQKRLEKRMDKDVKAKLERKKFKKIMYLGTSDKEIADMKPKEFN